MQEAEDWEVEKKYEEVVVEEDREDKSCLSETQKHTKPCVNITNGKYTRKTTGKRVICREVKQSVEDARASGKWRAQKKYETGMT